MKDIQLTPNQLAFIGLANEYCSTVEHAYEMQREAFIAAMLRLLPRLYISATDLAQPMQIDEANYIPSALDEEYYESVRRNIETLMGEDDTYLEVFESDMKYSDTPIAASISENLADIFQVLFNLTECVREAPTEVIDLSLQALKEDFEGYWSQALCNVLRALNSLKYNA